MASIVVPTEGICDYILVSNADPDLAVAYQENGDTMPHAYARANAGQLVTHPIEGRMKPIAFRGTTGNADTFQRTFLVAMDTAGNPASPVDRAPFDPIVALIEAITVPCVVLLDGKGRRWFTAPEFLEGRYNWQAHEHDADVHFVEVDGAPFPVITSSPWT